MALTVGRPGPDAASMDVESQVIVGGQSTLLKDAGAEVRRAFVRKVYGILSVQLLLTVAVAAPFQRMDAVQLQSQSWLLGLSVVMTILGVCVMTCCKELTRTYPTNYVLLFSFTLFEAVLVGFASAAYTWQSVMLSASLTAAIFAGLTVFAFKTKADFTGAGPMLFGALLSLISWGCTLLIMAACGVPIEWAIMFYDLVGVLMFVCYIVYDTQLIIGGEHKAHQFAIDDYVLAALNLYVDVIQLFLRLLRTMGKRK